GQRGAQAVLTWWRQHHVGRLGRFNRGLAVLRARMAADGAEACTAVTGELGARAGRTQGVRHRTASHCFADLAVHRPPDASNQRTDRVGSIDVAGPRWWIGPPPGAVLGGRWGPPEVSSRA